MPELMEAVSSVFKTLVDNEPKPPLTVVEVSNCWLYLAFLQDALGVSEGALNTTTDKDLSDCIHEEIHLVQSQMKILRQFLIDEGVPLPTGAEQKPKSQASDIPPGVKKTDYEIANELSLKIATATVTCATCVTESIRDDVGLMFSKFLSQKIAYGASLKTILRDRGWIKIPPYYTPSGTPNQ